jgi:flagellar hook-associated protein 3 FlgL
MVPLHFRTTQNLIVDFTVNNLHRNTSSVQRAQLELATGKKINKPSDDPLGARRALHLQNVDRRYEQYKSNIENASARLNESTVVLQEVTDLLMKAHDLAVRLNNDVLNDEQRREAAQEINLMLEQLVRLGNTNRDGEYIFSGTLKDTPTFEVERDANGQIIGITFQGNNEAREVNIGPGEQIAMNVGGGVVFQNPGGDVFQALLDLRDHLQSGEDLTPDIGNIRNAMNHVLDQVTELNSRYQILELTRERIESAQTINKNLLSLTEDADLARTILELQNAQNVLQSSLAVGAQVIPPSLLQYL